MNEWSDELDELECSNKDHVTVEGGENDYIKDRKTNSLI